MLRASGKHSGDDYDLTAVIGQSDDGDVADGATLIEFSEAVLDDDELVPGLQVDGELGSDAGQFGLACGQSALSSRRSLR